MGNNTDEQALFIAALDNLKEYAKVNGGIIKKQDILDNFGGVELEDSQLQLIYGYLLANQIKITDIDIKTNTFKEMLDHEAEKAEQAEKENEELEANDNLNYEEDEKFLGTYLEELNSIEMLSENTEALMLMTAAEGDTEAIGILVTSYLPRIVEWTNSYKRQGALASDLIQEGNLAVTDYFNGKQWIKTADWMERLKEGNMQDIMGVRNEVEDTLKRITDKVFTEFIEAQKGSSKVSKKVLVRVNAVNDWAKRLSEELGRKVTMLEVAEKMGITVDEVKEAINLTSDNMEDIQK